MKEITVIRSVLKEEIGWNWSLILIKCLFRKRKVFNKTHWVTEKTDESRFVKRIALAATLYLELQRKFSKEKAFEIVKRILVPIGINEQWSYFNSLELQENDTPMKKLIAFNDLMDKKGVAIFNVRKGIKQNDNVCHFIITRCIFHDFFVETGTPELTRLFCEIDREFFLESFPDFQFHRNGSWKNTIAYGKEYCQFVFEKKKGKK